MQAAAWLVDTSPLYEGQGITIDQNWLTSLPVSMDETCDSIETQNDADMNQHQTFQMINGVKMKLKLNTEIYNFAHGEENKPLSLFRDHFSKEMGYPERFLGQKRPDDKERLRNVHYSQISKSELRRSDHQAAMCVENIFFKAKKLQMMFLIGQS